jgi:GNAT superfamily N-acetyltransferase
MHYSWKHPGGEFEVSTDPSRIDLPFVHGFLTASYWAKGIPEQTVRRSIDHSLCFGVYSGSRQMGFARVISDLATFAYLADVFILEDFRGRGLSRWLMQCIMEHPELQGLRRWSLVTRDAHGLYRKFGFRELAASERWMERHNPEVYSTHPSKSQS